MNEISAAQIEIDGQSELFDASEFVVEIESDERDMTSFVTEQSYTAYKIYVLINKIGSAIGVGELVTRPQMMYNYARNGLIVKGYSVKAGTYTSREFTRAEVIEFVTKFVTKKISK